MSLFKSFISEPKQEEYFDEYTRVAFLYETIRLPHADYQPFHKLLEESVYVNALPVVLLKADAQTSVRRVYLEKMYPRITFIEATTLAEGMLKMKKAQLVPVYIMLDSKAYSTSYYMNSLRETFSGGVVRSIKIDMYHRTDIEQMIETAAHCNNEGLIKAVTQLNIEEVEQYINWVVNEI